MPKRSLWTEWGLALVDRMVDGYDQILEQLEIPLGMEQVSREEARRRVQAMTPAERQDLLQQVGPEAILELMRG